MKISIFIFLFLLVHNVSAQDQGSTCYGTTSNGYLEKGVKLPSSGPNYVSYGNLPELVGRTYVHSKVRDIIIGAYQALETQQPGKVYKYGETGFKEGGKFKPHKTHRNGLSVDFMVPVLDKKGKSVHLPTNALNKYGYNIDFDNSGKYGEYKIDYEALAAHIVSLDKAARKNGARIWRVLFDPMLQPMLYNTSFGDYIRKNIKIPDKRSWVRHDEYYHVDFTVECKPI